VSDQSGPPQDKSGHPAGDRRRLHNVRSHLSIILGFCDLLLAEIPDTDRKHADLLEIRKAAVAASALLENMPELP
jgi:hypothetical protein